MKNIPLITFSAEEKNFLLEIDSRIKTIVLELPEQYHDIHQIVNGNRFRPLLTYYGYKLFSNNLNEKIYNTAVAIELIHKASIIIDDIIDNDDKRNSMLTVHKQYSVDEALILTIFFLGKCIELLSEIDNSTVRLFSHLIIRMCNGTLEELNIDASVKISEIKEILENQTSQVIQNCLIIGMKSHNPKLENQNLEIVGYKVGYLFQLLNDCEAYFNPEFTLTHKGNYNFDINKSRKNLCYVYLEHFLSKKEQLEIKHNYKDNLKILLNKYNVFNQVKREVELIELDIDNHIRILEENFPAERLNYFINYSIELAKIRAGLS